jgi:chromosome partitioning protein
VAWIYAVAGNKGGPGKTAETIGLAYELARRGYHVTVADMDAQGNATRRLGVDKGALITADRPGIAQMLDPRRPARIDEVAVTCGWPDEAAARITVLPSLDRESLGERAEEAAKPGAATRLRRALEHDGWTDDQHVVLIDCGPDVNHLLHNAFMAADRVILVTSLNTDSIEGAAYLADYLDRQREALERPDLQVCGVVANAFNDESARQSQHAANLPATFARWGGADSLWLPYVPYRLSLANSHDDAVPVSAIRHVVVNELSTVYSAHADRLLAVQEGS